MKSSFAVFAAAVLFASAPVIAQTAAPAPAPIAAAAVDPAAMAATRQLLATMKMRDTMIAAMRQMEQQIPAQMRASIAAAINANPDLNAQQKQAVLGKLEQDMPAMSARATALMNDPSLIDEMIAQIAPLYAETFTVDELRQMTAFYASPTGQKVLAATPALMARGMEIGMRTVAPRVQKMLAESMQADAGH